jgi:hypothetical protein
LHGLFYGPSVAAVALDAGERRALLLLNRLIMRKKMAPPATPADRPKALDLSPSREDRLVGWLATILSVVFGFFGFLALATFFIAPANSRPVGALLQVSNLPNGLVALGLLALPAALLLVALRRLNYFYSPAGVDPDDYERELARRKKIAPPVLALAIVAVGAALSHLDALSLLIAGYQRRGPDHLSHWVGVYGVRSVLVIAVIGACLWGIRAVRRGK